MENGHIFYNDPETVKSGVVFMKVPNFCAAVHGADKNQQNCLDSMQQGNHKQLLLQLCKNDQNAYEKAVIPYAHALQQSKIVFPKCEMPNKQSQKIELTISNLSNRGKHYFL